jgi:carbamoyltransferase
VPFAAVVRFFVPDLLALDPAKKNRGYWRQVLHGRATERFRRQTSCVSKRKIGRPPSPRYVLGISAFYHDSAAALLVDGVVVAAAQEERFSRIRHDPGFPFESTEYCLRTAGIALSDVDLVVFYERPDLKLWRQFLTIVAFAPKGESLFRAMVSTWLGGKLFQRSLLRDALTICGQELFDDRHLFFSEHHLSHAASAFYASPFDDAAIIVVDGVGESATTTVAVGSGDEITIIKEIHFPHSLGLLYSAFTVYLGFRINSGEYKVMGLAPYGEPIFAELIEMSLIDLRPDGSFSLNMDYFEFGRDTRTINELFEDLFGGPARKPDEQLSRRHMDIAASIQHVLNKAMVRLAEAVAKETGQRNLCLSGGVALNCVSNTSINDSLLFDEIWIQPASGDAGCAVGAAFVGDIIISGQRRIRSKQPDGMAGCFLGPKYTRSEIVKILTESGAVFHELQEDQLIEIVADALYMGKAIGWFAGRMEFGPRALGARSILADARSPSMQKILNLKIKYRESFRPFAPAVLLDEASLWFDISRPSPYMLLTAKIKSVHRHPLTKEEEFLTGLDRLAIVRSSVPAITHIDDTARVQTVDQRMCPRFHRLISAFRARSGTGLIVNTSFNIRGEPIVCTPSDAYHCFMGTELDMLVMENVVLEKRLQNPQAISVYRDQVLPD